MSGPRILQMSRHETTTHHASVLRSRPLKTNYWFWLTSWPPASASHSRNGVAEAVGGRGPVFPPYPVFEDREASLNFLTEIRKAFEGP